MFTYEIFTTILIIIIGLLMIVAMWHGAYTAMKHVMKYIIEKKIEEFIDELKRFYFQEGKNLKTSYNQLNDNILDKFGFIESTILNILQIVKYQDNLLNQKKDD